MLYRMVGPMKRDRPRFRMHVRRIPVDVRDRLVGRRLRFSLGETTRIVTISPRAQSIRFSPSARTIRQKRRKETRQQIRHLRLAYAPCKTLKIVEWVHQKTVRQKRAVCFYFFLPDPNVGCQPAAPPFWLGAAAIVLTFSFLGFLDSRFPFCSPLAMPFSTS